MEPCNEVKQESEKAPEVREEQPKPRRFRIVKLEERIAPMAGGNIGYDIHDSQRYVCM